MTSQGWLFVAVALCGGLGALTRWWLDTLFSTPASRERGAQPRGVFLANTVASLLAGAALAAAANLTAIHPMLGNPMVWMLVVSGYLGGLSTFSTVAVDSVEMLRTRPRRFGRFLWNTVGMLTLSLALCFGAYWLVTALLRP